jgi:hypothetical protein
VLPGGVYKVKDKAYAIIQDSITSGGVQIRHLSEDWINKRTYVGLYFKDLKYHDETVQPFLPKTKFIFRQNLQMEMRNDDVLELQRALQHLGFFPSNIVPTGYYGGITRQAVKDFQEKYRPWILKPLGLSKPTGIFGDRTRNKLNEILR